jgi:crotonobetainyl-CoA:carnitine CoA-transferase CaiB-like acyl-CoA transferase
VHPLQGITVVAVEQAVAAPICTRHLGDLGARVIKVESRAGGDFARGYDEVVNGLSAYFAWANRNKESVALDLKHPLGADALRAAHPRLIVVGISGYGNGGPYAKARAYDLLAQSEGGSCAITGFAGMPAKPGMPIADIGAGMYALSSILAALFVRERTGEGTAISVGMFDAVAEWMGYALNIARYAGVDLEPNGVSSPAVAPYGSYRTADGQTLVLGTTNDREWRRLAADVLHRPDLAEDPRYATNSDRIEHRAELDAVIGAWAAGLSLADCRAAAEAAALGHARLNRPTEVLTHPQLTERDRWREIGSPVGPVLGLLPPPESPDWDLRLDPIPALGQHTEAVLRELGFDAAAVAAMRQAGVIDER